MSSVEMANLYNLITYSRDKIKQQEGKMSQNKERIYQQLSIYINFLISIYWIIMKIKTENKFLTTVHRKLALSVSFCVRKVDFPVLMRLNFKCAEN